MASKRILAGDASGVTPQNPGARAPGSGSDGYSFDFSLDGGLDAVAHPVARAVRCHAEGVYVLQAFGMGGGGAGGFRLRRTDCPPPDVCRGERGEVTQFSSESKRRLRESVQSLSHVFRRLERGCRASFATLTYWGEDVEGGSRVPDVASDPRACYGHLKAFVRRLQSRWPGAFCVWIKELQRRGAIHYHLLMVMPVDGKGWLDGLPWSLRSKRDMAKLGPSSVRSFQEWVAVQWADVNGCPRKYRARHKRAGTNVRPINPDKADDAIAEYLAKAKSKGPDADALSDRLVGEMVKRSQKSKAVYEAAASGPAAAAIAADASMAALGGAMERLRAAVADAEAEDAVDAFVGDGGEVVDDLARAVGHGPVAVDCADRRRGLRDAVLAVERAADDANAAVDAAAASCGDGDADAALAEAASASPSPQEAAGSRGRWWGVIGRDDFRRVHRVHEMELPPDLWWPMARAVQAVWDRKAIEWGRQPLAYPPRWFEASVAAALCERFGVEIGGSGWARVDWAACA